MTLTPAERTWVIATPLAFGAVGFEQLLHTGTDPTLPVYEVLHWASDRLLALPLAAPAVWGAARLAAWRGLDGTSRSEVLLRAEGRRHLGPGHLQEGRVHPGLRVAQPVRHAERRRRHRWQPGLQALPAGPDPAARGQRGRLEGHHQGLPGLRDAQRRPLDAPGDRRRPVGQLPELGKAIGDGFRELKKATNGQDGQDGQDEPTRLAAAPAHAVALAECAMCGAGLPQTQLYCGACGSPHKPAA